MGCPLKYHLEQVALDQGVVASHLELVVYEQEQLLRVLEHKLLKDLR